MYSRLNDAVYTEKDYRQIIGTDQRKGGAKDVGKSAKRHFYSNIGTYDTIRYDTIWYDIFTCA